MSSTTRTPAQTAEEAIATLRDYLEVSPGLDHAPDLRMVRLWVNRDGSRTDVVVFIADGGNVRNVTHLIAAGMGEPLHMRRPEGWALRLSSGGVSPASIIEDRLQHWTGRHVRVFG